MISYTNSACFRCSRKITRPGASMPYCSNCCIGGATWCQPITKENMPWTPADEAQLKLLQDKKADYENAVFATVVQLVERLDTSLLSYQPTDREITRWLIDNRKAIIEHLQQYNDDLGQ